MHDREKFLILLKFETIYYMIIVLITAIMLAIIICIVLSKIYI